MLATVVALSACLCVRLPPEADVRPLTLRVVDAKTRAPLKGIPVVWALETMVVDEVAFYGCIPNVHPDVGTKLAFEDEGITDAQGEVTFRPGKVRFEGNERVEREYAFVNLRADPSSEATQLERKVRTESCRSRPAWLRCDGPDHGAHETYSATHEPPEVRRVALLNPVRSHRGVMLTSSAWPRSLDRGDWTLPDDPFRSQGNYESLGDKPEVVVVPLEAR